MRLFRLLALPCAIVILACAWTAADPLSASQGTDRQPGTCCWLGSDCPGYNDICCYKGSDCGVPPNIYNCVQNPKDCK